METSTPFPGTVSDDDEANDPFVALENIIIAYNLARQKKASATIDSVIDAENPTKRQRRDSTRTQIRFSNVDKAGAAAFSKHCISADENQKPVAESSALSSKIYKYAGTQAPVEVDTRAQESN
jgi:hypothetical protein